MKDGPEAAEGVKTASSATNGEGDKCDMRDLDEQSCRNGVSEVAVDINALPVGGTLLTDAASTNGDSDKVTKNGVPKNGEKQFACRICSRSFGYKHVLQNHERTHTGEKPFECPECHKRFTRDHHLKTHMRLHTGEKPYQCSHCDRHFVQVANLRRHLRVHTGERPYACQMCESRFSDSNQLKAHMLIHRGEKPFQCLECMGRFRRRHHLIHHKCPKGDSGKPRKGRQPKIYEPIHTSDHEDNEEDLDGDLLPELSDNEENMVDTNNSSSEAEQQSPTSAHSVETMIHNHNHHHNNNNHHHNELMVMSNGLTNGTNGVTNISNGVTSISNGVNNISNGVANISNGVTNISNGVTNGNRRKPSRTIRILTPQQRELFIRDKLSMQTQAIDMRLSPSSVEVQPVTVIVPNRFLSTVEGVLDLSSSRSDSEIEIIDDDLRHHKNCDCHLHPFARRPLSQRIADQKSKILGISNGLEPLNGTGRTAHHSDDSNESHSHLNGGRHLSDDDNSIGAIALTTKKLHVATA